MERDGDVFVVRGAPESLAGVQQALARLALNPATSGIEYEPTNFTPVTAQDARSITSLLEALEENDDVQKVHTNAEFPDGFEV
jgi:transcriptional/translational regulatory protein YebC/TACO1